MSGEKQLNDIATQHYCVSAIFFCLFLRISNTVVPVPFNENSECLDSLGDGDNGMRHNMNRFS